jgi:type II secretion system protein J
LKINPNISPERAADNSPGQASLRASPWVKSSESRAAVCEAARDRQWRCHRESDLRPSVGSGLSQKRKRGFTLIEIMLSLAIFTLLTAALYASWVLVIRAMTVGKGKAAQLQRERIAMRTLEDSLTCIQSHQASIDYYLFDVQNGDSPDLSFTAYLPDNFPRSGEFIDNNNPNGLAMDFHMRRVDFSLQADESGQGKDLVLRQNPVLMDMSASEKNTPLILARNVSAFLIECWDTNTMAWDTTWDSTNIIPTLVRVTLAFGDGSSGPVEVVTREVSFPSTTMPTMVQTPNNNGNFIGGPNFYKNGQQGNSPSGSPGGGAISPQSMSIQAQPPETGPPPN